MVATREENSMTDSITGRKVVGLVVQNDPDPHLNGNNCKIQ
jgi:hypothetical protein